MSQENDFEGDAALDPRAVSRLHALCRANSLFALIVATLALTGRAIEQPLLVSFGRNLPPMKGVASVLVLLVASAQLARRPAPRLALGFATVALTLALTLATLLATAVPLNGAAARLLELEHGLAPTLILGVILLSLGELSTAPALPNALRVDLWGRATVAIALLALFGYLSGPRALEVVRPFASLSLPSALSLLALGAASSLQNERVGFASLLTSVTTVSRPALWMLCAIVIVPFGLGLAVAWSVTSVGIPATFALGICSTLTVLLLGQMLWHASRALHLSEIRRRQIEKERQAILEEMRHSEKMEAVGRLAGGLSHDFNNLLMIIVSHTDFLLEDLASSQKDPSALRQGLDQIRKATLTAKQLTEQLMTFSRRQPRKTDELDLNHVVLSMEGLLARALPEGVELRLDLAPLLPWVRADMSGIEQILLNLILNARDAMPKGGRITISSRCAPPRASLLPPPARGEYATKTEDWVHLSVSDTGCGMDNLTRARIFDPFFTTKVDGGTGLGLSTVFALVAQYQGTISVESTPGAGSTFTMTFPAGQVAASGTRRVLGSNASPGERTGSSRGT